MTAPLIGASPALSSAQATLADSARKAREADAEKSAEEYESVFLTTMLSQAFTEISAEPPFGGGNAEKTWRSFLIEEYAKGIAAQGGLGLADRIKQELLSLQEVSP
ncbi:MAG: rod-binding protein [Hyphomicrobiales bacterium]|nr:rod-binding protein [Hyphomicrobiales bacterium]